jgi:aminoglycoside 3-N-acetyltransferase I
VKVRRLGPGDEGVVRSLGTQGGPARASELLADDRTLFLGAFQGEAVVGFLLGYELIRRHSEASHLFVYELGVDPQHRRRGVATALMDEVASVARRRGIRSAFLLTNESNGPAMALYDRLGGRRLNQDDVLWDFVFE